ncbi:hypothetical protein WJX72_005490 [[Myrmecia] bisecta]|uniref:EF-hand domain-containing protein n=1 Tax=[Myrmecia] bisecta TaxID=41462 RepID=A0AAW1Q7B3_9CHLO
MASPEALLHSDAVQDRVASAGPSHRDLAAEELRLAWQLLNPEGKPSLTLAEVLQTSHIFFPHTSPKDLRAILGPGSVTLHKLQALLESVPRLDHDPKAAAFRHLDPSISGFADVQIMRHMLEQLPGIGEMTDEDLEVLLLVADADRDGRVSLQDFVNLERKFAIDERSRAEEQAAKEASQASAFDASSAIYTIAKSLHMGGSTLG